MSCCFLPQCPPRWSRPATRLGTGVGHRKDPQASPPGPGQAAASDSQEKRLFFSSTSAALSLDPSSVILILYCSSSPVRP